MIKTKMIAIIGAGFSGVMTAVNILNQNNKNIKILLIDKNNTVAKGLAYGIEDHNLLLNVPASNMSAFANEPAHFLNYCKELNPSINKTSFVQRKIYGKYLEHILSSAIKKNPNLIEIVKGEVIGLNDNEGNFKLQFKNGKILIANKVVLALGHFSKELRTDIDQKFLIKPWDFHTISKLEKNKTVAIMGMGHTAIDILFKLTEPNNGRKVIMFSRRGLLPHSHKLNPNPRILNKDPDYLKNTKPKILNYFRALRNEIKKCKANGIDWREVLMEFRPHTATIFQLLPVSEKTKFLKKIVFYWDIHRHLLAPEANLKLNELIRSKQVIKIAGSLNSLKVIKNMLELKIKLKKTNEVKGFSVGAFIDCSGSNYNLDQISSPLIKQLYQSGQIQPDDLRLGIKIDDHYHPINKKNKSSENLYYIGPMLRAKYWEAIAVPELSQHCKYLATNIINS